MKSTYQITEYGSFVSGKEIDGCVALPEKTFDQLEEFILSNRSKETDTLELMGLSARKGVGRIITAKNYVANNVTLLYPMTDRVPLEECISYHSKDGVTVRIEFVDLFNVRESLIRVMHHIQGGNT